MAGDRPQPSASSALVCRGTQQAPRPRRPSATPWRPHTAAAEPCEEGGPLRWLGARVRRPWQSAESGL